MNKTYLIYRHEFLQEVKKASFVIMTLIVPLLALLAIGVFKLVITPSAPPQEVAQATGHVDQVGVSGDQPTRGAVDPNLANIVIPGVFSLLLGLSLMFGATSLISGLAEEKESRLIQVLFSSVSIRQLLIGKVLALGTAGLLQVLVWLLSTPLLLGLVLFWRVYEQNADPGQLCGAGDHLLCPRLSALCRSVHRHRRHQLQSPGRNQFILDLYAGELCAALAFLAEHVLSEQLYLGGADHLSRHRPCDDHVEVGNVGRSSMADPHQHWCTGAFHCRRAVPLDQDL